MLQCLDNAVGVTKDECPCLIEGLEPAEKLALKTAKSGLYLDALPGGIDLKDLKDLDGCKSFPRMALDAIAQGQKDLEDELKTALNDKYKNSAPAFVGMLGQQSYTSSLPAGKRYRALRIQAATHSDAVLHLERITLIMNDTVTMDLILYKVPRGEFMGTVVKTWEAINVTANTYKNIAVDPSSDPNVKPGLSLPMREDGREVDYYFVYDSFLPIPFQPKDTKVSCGCGGEDVLKEYVNIQGGQLDSLANFNAITSEPFTEGILLSVTIKCDNTQLFCREYNNDEAIAVAMARCIWFRAGEMLIEAVQKSGNINRYTVMEDKYLWGKRNHFRKEFYDRITYIANVIDINSSNCYVCRETSNQPFFSGILS